jgi:hypothetical protein
VQGLRELGRVETHRVHVARYHLAQGLDEEARVVIAAYGGRRRRRIQQHHRDLPRGLGGAEEAHHTQGHPASGGVAHQNDGARRACFEDGVGVGADEAVPFEESFVGLVAGVTGHPHLAGVLKVRRYLGILQHARWGEDADGPGTADIPATSNPHQIRGIYFSAEPYL